MKRRSSGDLYRKDLVRMIAKLRGILYDVKFRARMDVDLKSDIDEILAETTFDVDDKDDWSQK